MSATMLTEETKAIEVHRIQTLIGDNRLDATSAISFAIEAFGYYTTEDDRDNSKTKRTTRQILWLISDRNLDGRLMYIKMMGVSVKAFEILHAEAVVASS